jgi:DNA-binding XRE family transcriptional regulator
MKVGDRVMTPDGVGTVISGEFRSLIDSSGLIRTLWWWVDIDEPSGLRVFRPARDLEQIDEPIPTTAARLRAYRSRHAITQEELARRLGCTARTVRRWEEGDASPTGLYKQAVERLIGGEDV